MKSSWNKEREREREREKREEERKIIYCIILYTFLFHLWRVKAWGSNIFVMKFSGPLLNRAFLLLCFPATMRYHFTSERMENDLNAGVYTGPKDWENMCRTGFGQKTEARSDGQRSRSCCWICAGCSLRSGLEEKQLTYFKTGKSHKQYSTCFFLQGTFFPVPIGADVGEIF